MDERRMRRRLKSMLVIITTIIVILITAGIFTSIYSRRTLDRELNSQIRTETDEYIRRMEKQIEADFKSLGTIGTLLEGSELIGSERFSDTLNKANKENDFVTLMYFNTEGEGIAVSEYHEPENNLQLSTIYPEYREVIESALDGESRISHPFESEFSGQIEFAYGVPVYESGEIVGAFAGSDTIRVFSEILDVKGILGGHGYAHLLGQDGTFIIRSGQDVVSEEMDSVFDGLYFGKNETEKIREAMKKGDERAFSFDYKGQTYRSLLSPVKYNGWYFLCVSTYQDNENAMHKLSVVIAFIFVAILAMVGLLMTYGYVMMKRSYQDLVSAAYMDSLCGIYNRNGFLKKASEEILENDAFAIAAVNIHQFKFINEMFGQLNADSLLRFVSSKISGILMEGEFLCRDAGDSFYIFLRRTDKKKILQLLQTIMEEVEGISTQVGSSYHLKLYCSCVVAGENDGSDLNKMMTHLLFTLTKAKEDRKKKIHFYDNELYEQLQLENYVEAHMQQALENEEFKMYLQPKIDLKTGKLHGAEALVRWETESGRRIFPDQFIPIFEQNGFCMKLDLYMIERACRQISEWVRQGIRPIGISVNQTKLLFYDVHYVERLEALIRKYNVKAELITIEILEGIAVGNMEELNSKIDKLRDIGFRVSMDDFGSGYSSLNVLSKIHIDELKIDREFLRELSTSEELRTEAVLGQIVGMTRELGIETVVEGVETKEQEQMVFGLGCDFGQGYYYSRPVPQAQFHEEFMIKRKQ